MIPFLKSLKSRYWEKSYAHGVAKNHYINGKYLHVTVLGSVLRAPNTETCETQWCLRSSKDEETEVCRGEV